MFDRTNNKEQIYILSHRHSERFQFLENTIAVGKFKKFRRCYVGNDKGGGKKRKNSQFREKRIFANLFYQVARQVPCRA